MTVWISRSVLAKITADAEEHCPLETGGVLLGWRDGNDRIVVDVIGPGPNALHGRHRFIPDHKWQMRAIRAAFERSHGDLDYLGDWHTHPHGMAMMSNEDCATLRRIGRRVPSALMLIAAGSRSQNWLVGCWMHQGSSWLRAATAEPQATSVFDKPEAWPGREMGVAPID